MVAQLWLSLMETIFWLMNYPNVMCIICASERCINMVEGHLEDPYPRQSCSNIDPIQEGFLEEYYSDVAQL